MAEELEYYSILGTRINVTDMEKTVQYLDGHLEELRGRYVCVSNVHTTVTAYRDKEYGKVQNGAAMNLPDGKPLSIVQQKAGCSGARRVPGPDLMPELFALSEKKGYRHYFYGSRQETLDMLEKKLREKYPRLQIAGMYSPPFRSLTEAEDQAAVDAINAAKPDFIWVGLGAPKQERWMAAHDGRVCGVMLGVGAGFDFHAGTIKRAPKWMQEVCMEWLYRIGQDPKRLLWRYLDTNFSFLYYLIKERITGGRGMCGQDCESGRCGTEAANPAGDGHSKAAILRNKKGKPLKIAMIGHKRIPSREGGVEIVVDELSTRMVRLGYRVDAYNRYGRHVAGKRYQQYKGKDYKGVRLITIPTFRNGKLNAIVYSILAAVRAVFGGYDVIHFHAEGPCVMIWLPHLLGIRTVATIHGLDWQRSKWGNFASKVLILGEKMAARYADELIVLSENMQEYFRTVYHRQTRFIPNGINRPERLEADLIREKYGLEKDGYILFLARIVPEKGVHYLIDAYRQLDTGKRLVIAGGNSHSQEYMHEIEQMASEDERILMTGFVSGRVLEELYSNAFLFVLPSDVEGMAVCLLEAMSYGNCCLVSDIPENMEVVGEHAVSFHQSDVASLWDKLKYLLEDEEARQSYREKAADFICGRYNWDEVVEQTLQLYL